MKMRTGILNKEQMEKFDMEPYNDKRSSYDFKKEESYLRAKKKLENLVGFYWHLAAYIIVNLFLVILVGTNSDAGFWSFGTFATPLFWGIGLAFHFLGVFGPDFIFGKNWENRKIKEYMDKDKEEHQRFQ